MTEESVQEETNTSKDGRKEGCGRFDDSGTVKNTQRNGWENLSNGYCHYKSNSFPHDTKSELTTLSPKGKGNKLLFSKMQMNSKLTLGLGVIIMFLASCSLAVIAPFYPSVAKHKGMSIATVGWVFGIYQISFFVSSLICGTYLTSLGPKFVYIAGVAIGGSTNVIFGVLDKSPDGMSFTALSITTRVIMAVGISGIYCAGFAIVASEFPNNVAFTFSLMETAGGLGYIVGPLLGGVLYDYGGYGCPFFVLGGSLLMFAFVVLKLLGSVKEIKTQTEVSMLRLLVSPTVVMAVLIVFFGYSAFSAYEATFSQHVLSFNLSSSAVGALFCIAAVTYGSTSPILGYFSDTRSIGVPLMIGGIFFSGLTYWILAPSIILTFLPFNLWTICTGLALLGFSLSGVLVPTIKCMIQGAIELGYEDRIDTYGLVSGLYMALMTLGGFVGPVASTQIIALYDIDMAYNFLGLLCFAMTLIALVYFVMKYFKNRICRENAYDEL